MDDWLPIKGDTATCKRCFRTIEWNGRNWVDRDGYLGCPNTMGSRLLHHPEGPGPERTERVIENLRSVVEGLDV